MTARKSAVARHRAIKHFDYAPEINYTPLSYPDFKGTTAEIREQREVYRFRTLRNRLFAKRRNERRTP